MIMRPVNVGSLLRTADAFGVKKIIFGGSPIELNKKTWNASRATENVVDFKQVEDTVCEIKNYKEAGYRVIALEITDESVPLNKLKNNTNQDTVLIVGSERHGVRKELLDLSDEVYHIEMYGQNSSMNVVQATSRWRPEHGQMSSRRHPDVVHMRLDVVHMMSRSQSR